MAHTPTVRPLSAPGAMGLRISVAENGGQKLAGKKTSAVEVPGRNFETDELAGIKSFDDALALVKEKMGDSSVGVADQEIGDGFKLLENKDLLSSVECLFVTWDFHQGDHGEFVSAKVVTIDGAKYIVNDGSSGIRDQLMSYSAKKNSQGGLFCRKGLRRSDYKYTDENGVEKPATTYYLDTSA